MRQITLLSALAVVSVVCAVQALARENGVAMLDQMAGQPVEISPWAYDWRADRAVQGKPEAYFVPRRLERIDTVYRTAIQALPEKELKSLYYEQPDLLNPLAPKPKGKLLAGLLWTGGLVDYQVDLCWPVSAGGVPAPETVEVRVYPTSWGWFGWTVDKIMTSPRISADGKTWTYKSTPGEKMDYAYSRRVDAATEMVAVFCEAGPSGGEPAVPSIRISGPSLGQWKRTDVEIEWGFQAGAEGSDFDGRLETNVAMTGPVSALVEDKGTTVTGAGLWRSKSAGAGRRGIVIPVLYAPSSRLGLDSRITVWTGADGFTFRVSDLDKGPILMPEHGVFVTKAGSGQTARRYAEALAAKGNKSIRQMTRERRETASWEETMKEVRLWTCPAGTTLAPFPEVEAPPMDVDLPDPGWTSAWRAGSAQLKGPNMWGGLAHEVGRVVHAMDLVGLHAEADKVYNHFLTSPGIKSDGDFTDGSGSLEWAASMRHDMGYSHDGTHASTGRLLFAMAERYFLTGDKAWFEKNRSRLQSAADWIIRQRKLYMMNIPCREDLFVSGLMPPCMLGDYALPASDWHWYYSDNTFALQGIQRFADALAEFDEEAGRKYRLEAEAFRQDIHRVAKKDAALSPVRLGRDGMYHSYIPRMAYARGLTGQELGAPQYADSELDSYVGALPLAEYFSALDANDTAMAGTLDVMTEMTTSDKAVQALEEQRKAKGLSADDAWYWLSYVSLPKISHNANIFLLQDDVPNFLRFWTNGYATMVGADGKLWEHWHLGNYANCEAPDNGTAGWFMENFRNLLVMEEGSSLWVARATPRAWLEQGKRISVKSAPTYFGDLAYEIKSDVDHGKIVATVDIPSRKELQSVILRLRHPKTSPIRNVSVNGEPWADFDAAKEIIRLRGKHGSVSVEARY
ncbi:MAG: hypothetical protein HZB26_01270 [Candidatus Hydrogenedentes bacterium]|nr:hypothetical protein [Candidatus Hydrogenedentota bacterium]